MQASAFVIQRFSHAHLQNVSLPLLLAYLIFWIRVCISHTGSLTSVAPIQRSRGGESSHPITSLKNEQSRWHAVTIENVYIYIWFALDIICTISEVYNCKCACDHTALCRWRLWAKDLLKVPIQSDRFSGTCECFSADCALSRLHISRPSYRCKALCLTTAALQAIAY